MPATVALDEIVGLLAGLDQDVEDAQRVARIRALERIKSAAAAAQARETVAFAASQQAAQLAQGVDRERSRQGIAGQVGLARRCSPFHAARALGWARILVEELPRTYAALACGAITEWRAMLVARETSWLSREHRALVDAELGPRLEQWGDRQVEREAKRSAYRLDPAGAVERTSRAARDRRVGIRPMPETMAAVTVLAPVAQSVAAYAALARHADTLIGTGDRRSRGQIMADTAIERLTGQAHAAAVPVEINLVMTDQTLLGSSSDAGEPAHLDGYGPIPAPLARELVLGADPGVPMWLRRLYTRPGCGELMTMDSRRRAFTPAMRHFVAVRDQSCRTPWCDAPIRHVDHIQPHAAGGPTRIGNGQGYCAACNYAKQAPGWSTTTATTTTSGDAVTTRTPTGATYTSRPPEPPRTAPPKGVRSRDHARLRVAVEFTHLHHAA